MNFRNLDWKMSRAYRSVREVAAGPLRRMWYRLSLAAINRRHPDRPPQYVHDESALLDVLNASGWTVADQREIMRRNARVNYFYRLVRR